MRATWPAGLVLAFALFAVSCGSGDAASTAKTQASSSAASKEDERGKSLGVLTRNLYLGADLAPVIGAQTPQAFVAATTAVWLMVQKNDFRVRAKALAAEIAETRPALIGLQEAVTWRTRSPSTVDPEGDVAFDYIPLLLQALKERGLDYREVAKVTLLDVEGPTALGFNIRLTDHDAILARANVRATNGKGFVYGTILTVNTLAGPVAIKRGWVSADVEHRGEHLRFVNTHLESFVAPIRTAQATELKAALAKEARPVILTGDLNSHPGTEGEAVLASAGFVDAWGALHPRQAGLTCCFLEDLTKVDGAALTERIDYVLLRGALEAGKARVLGDTRGSRVGGLWPSDHAGLFATAALGDEEEDD
jgi:endonuclease/exonuclease/phosphatase family metal-dependent hydrolase